MSVPFVSEQDFEQEVLQSELPVLINFIKSGSPYCVKVAPEVDAIALELDGKAKVVKVDIDKAQSIATKLRVQAVPTFMVFVRGRPVAGDQGLLMRNQLREMLSPFLQSEGSIKALELVRLLQQAEVTAVDTRDAYTYGRAHIPSAANIPMEEIESRIAELHMLGSTPVLYCHAGDKSKDLAQKLAGFGVTVTYLEGGFLAWEGEALPVERPD